MNPMSSFHSQWAVLFQQAIPATSSIPVTKKHTAWNFLLIPNVCTKNWPIVSKAQIKAQAPTAPTKLRMTMPGMPSAISAVSMKSHSRSIASAKEAIVVRKRVNLEVSWQKKTQSARRTLATAKRIQSQAVQTFPNAAHTPTNPRKPTTSTQMMVCDQREGRGQMGKASCDSMDFLWKKKETMSSSPQGTIRYSSLPQRSGCEFWSLRLKFCSCSLRYMRL